MRGKVAMEKKKIEWKVMMFIVATDVIANRLERRTLVPKFTGTLPKSNELGLFPQTKLKG